MKSLKTTSMLLIFVIISIIAIIFIFYSIFSRNVESSASKHLVTVVSLKKESLDIFLGDIEHSMSSINQAKVTQKIFSGNCAKGDVDSCNSIINDSDIFNTDNDRINGFYFFNKDGELFLSEGNNIDSSESNHFKKIISSFIDKNSVREEDIFLPVKTNKSDIYSQIYFSDIFEEESSPYMFSLLVVFNNKGTVLGSVVADISVSTLYKLFNDKENLKDSEEIYLIGTDLVMRTDSRLFRDSTKFSQIVDTENAKRCFSGEKNIDGFFENYRGSLSLEAHEYIPQLDWCLIAEIDKREIMHVRSILIKIFILLGLVSIGTLLLFFEKIVTNTNYLKKKQLDLTKALFEKEKFKKALDTAEDNVFILDMEGRVIYMNKSVSLYTGFSSSEVIGKKINTLWWSKVDKKLFKDIFDKIFSENRPGTWEIKSNRKDGTIYNSEIFITPVLKEGELAFVLVIEHDIDKRKKLESMKDEFIGIASHELRTPMTVIRGYASLLLDKMLGPLTDKQAETLKKIDGNSEKLIKLVTDMLDLSKLNSMQDNNGGINNTKLDLRDLIEDVSDGFKVLASKKNITYKTNYNTETNIVSNPILIKRVLTNVIGNALKFTPEDGNISVNITSSKKDDFIRIEIFDDGQSIPEKYKDVVFEKFSQVEDYIHKNKANEGTGLGLPISKKIIESLGGIIDFKNKEGGGITFFFEVPRK